MTHNAKKAVEIICGRLHTNQTRCNLDLKTLSLTAVALLSLVRRLVEIVSRFMSLHLAPKRRLPTASEDFNKSSPVSWLKEI